MYRNRLTSCGLGLALLTLLVVECPADAREEAKADVEPVSVPVATAVHVRPDSTDAISAGQLDAESPTETPPTETLRPETLAEEFHLPLDKHPWTRFLPGAWREVEITTEVFNQAGESMGQSVTTQREQLQSIADDSYVLQISATVDYSGSTIEATPNTRALKILTDTGGQVFQTLAQPDQILQLGEQSVSTKVWDIVFNNESQNLRQRIFYSPEMFPYVLRRHVSENKDETPVEQVPVETTEVIAREIPYTFQEQPLPCVGMKTTRRHPKGSTETLQLHNPEIPGGEVISWSTDFDSHGRRIRWTVRKTRRYGSVNENLSQHASTPNQGTPEPGSVP